MEPISNVPPKPDFDGMYAMAPGSRGWEIGHPQRAFLALAEAGAINGAVLDVGCGTGEHALMAAAMGFDATGIDIAAGAISAAAAKARSRGLTAKFLVHDALRLAALGEQYDIALDCGLFHVFSKADRPVFADGLHAALRQGGRYLMLCFREVTPGSRADHQGPPRLSEQEITETFTSGWRINSIEADRLQTIKQPAGVAAWLADITRL